jgi:nitronate monooxygenase
MTSPQPPHADLPLAPPIRTPLSARLGLRYPFVCAPMFIISNVEMLVACAEAGILGAIPSLNGRSHEDFRAILAAVRARTSAPFAVNLTIGLTDPARRMADLEACLEYAVPVLITSYGDPTEVVVRAHSAGVFVMHDVVNLRHALKAQAAGVDALIAVGAGAGGHAGQISPLALIPWLCAELHVPVVAAGSIGTGAQALAALSLGAELCYMGTRFIATRECGAVDAYKELVTRATPEEIVYTDSVSGVHANFLRSTLPDVGPRSRSEPHKQWRDVWSAGHGVAQISSILTISEVVQEVAWGYWGALGRVRGFEVPGTC